jgi:hypothetical protein
MYPLNYLARIVSSQPILFALQRNEMPLQEAISDGFVAVRTLPFLEPTLHPSNGPADVVRLLLEAGANMNIQNSVSVSSLSHLLRNFAHFSYVSCAQSFIARGHTAYFFLRLRQCCYCKVIYRKWRQHGGQK